MGAHTHDVQGEDAVEIRQNKQIAMAEKKPSEPDDSSSGEETSDEEEARFIAVVTTREHITIHTHWWSLSLCRRPTCPLDTQHCHMVFDPDTNRKEMPRVIRLAVCRNPRCPHQPEIHSHRADNGQATRLEIPPLVLLRVWGIRTREVNMIVQNIGVIEPTTDDRGDAGYIADYFRCSDRECP